MTTTTGAALDRNGLARWYAMRHLEIDSGVDLVFHLPTNAPEREIRFVEVNHLISETSQPEPIDFGVDIGGDNPHVLYVLDVTPNQWQSIESGQMALPQGWTLQDKQVFTRK